MITKLSMTNFKAWKRISDMRLAPITGVFGVNSSGKTSILQLLLMLRQTVESSDRLQVLSFGDEASLANLGSFRETVHESKAESSISFKVQWAMKEDLKVSDPRNPERSGGSLFSGR